MYISSNFNVDTNLQVLLTGEVGKSKEVINLTFSQNYSGTYIYPTYIRFFIDSTPFYTHEIAPSPLGAILDLSECPMIINAGQKLSAQIIVKHSGCYGNIYFRLFGVTKEISE